MQTIMRNRPNAGYENRDVITTVDDSHVFSSFEQDSAEFTIETGITMTEDERAKMLMTDEAPTNFSAISQLPTFRSLSTGRENLKPLHRRKYQYNNGLFLKPNAQERI